MNEFPAAVECPLRTALNFSQAYAELVSEEALRVRQQVRAL
jgi:hypothetical protein